jgi:stage V sporulation protein G
MEITSVRIYKKDKEGSNIKAVASVVIDDSFVVHGLRVVESDGVRFLGMPRRKVADGEYKDIAHALNTETRTKLEDAVFKAYEEELSKEEE